MGFDNLPGFQKCLTSFIFVQGEEICASRKLMLNLLVSLEGEELLKHLVCNIKLGLISQQLLHSLDDVGPLEIILGLTPLAFRPDRIDKPPSFL